MNKASFTGKRYLITGGSRGIGKALALSLKAQGAQVAIFSRSIENIESDEREAFCDVAINCDVADIEQQQKAFDVLKSEWPAIDGIFINAGVSGFSSILDMPMDEYDRVMNINLRAAFISLQLAGQWMKNAVTHNLQSQGHIVACCSLSSFYPENNIAHYNMAKSALAMLVKTAAREFGQFQVRVNGVAPGLTETDLIAGSEAIPGFHERVASRTPLGRLGSPDDIVPSIEELFSTQWVTGQTVIVDGGLSLFTPTDPLES